MLVQETLGRVLEELQVSKMESEDLERRKKEQAEREHFESKTRYAFEQKDGGLRNPRDGRELQRMAGEVRAGDEGEGRRRVKSKLANLNTRAL